MEYMNRPYSSGRNDYQNRKNTFSRQRAATKIYRMLEMRLFVDARLVKRFRIWQIHIIKGDISRFLKNVRRTNVKYMTNRLKVIMKILSKPTRNVFTKIANHISQKKLPTLLLPNLGVCKLFGFLNKKQSKTRLTTVFKLHPNMTDSSSSAKTAFNL